jgi:hypothetical protein
MKQSKLLKEVYAASLSHNADRLKELRKLEFEKIAQRKAKGKPFTPKWTIAEI